MSDTESWSAAKKAAQMHQELSADENDMEEMDDAEVIGHTKGTSARYLPSMKKGPRFDAYTGTSSGDQGLEFKEPDF